jgi:lipopolysaccharide export system permease protein
MLFHSSLRKELARSFGGTVVVLLTIVGTIALIRTFGFASKGWIDAKDLALVLGYTMLGQLPIVLTMSLFISIVGTFSRMYREHEMDIWLSAGQGLFGFLRPLYRFAWPVLVVIGVAALAVWPWSNQQIADLRERFEQRGDLERVEAGQFQESAGGERVFFIDRDQASEGKGRNIFIATQQPHKESVTSAKDGRVESLDGDRYVLLSTGQRMEWDLKDQSIKVSEFAEYGTKVQESKVVAAQQKPSRQVSSAELLKSSEPILRGELSWRLGMLLSAINLVVLALAVSTVNPRASRSSNLVFALFAFIIYYNLVNMGQAWIAAERVKPGPFLVVLHGSVFLGGLLWLFKRHIGFSFKSLLLRRVAALRGKPLGAVVGPN